MALQETAPEIIPDKEPMELQVISNVHKFEWNFQEIKAAVQAHIEKYHGLVVNEDNLKDMESAQKELAGVRTKIDGFRKKVKKLLDEPYKNFEAQIKELQSLVEKAETPLKEQILKYEDDRRDKQENYWTCWMHTTAKNMGLRDNCALTQLSVKPQWLNRTAKEATIRKEIVTEIEQLLDQQRKADEAAELQRQKTELIAQLCVSTSKTFMLKTVVVPEDVKHLVFSAGLAEIPGIIADECRKRAEMEQKAAEPPQPEFTPPSHVDAAPPMPSYTQECAPAPYPPMPPVPAKMPPCPPPINTALPELWDANLRVWGITVSQAEALKAYMSQNGIKFEFSGYTRR